MERPTPFFLQLMTHYTALPVNKASIEKDGKDFTKPGKMVTNGAYMLTEYVANDHVTAVKNPHYWDAANVKIDKVIYNPSEDQAATERMFENGELDMSITTRPTSATSSRRSWARTRSTPARRSHLLLRLRHAS